MVIYGPGPDILRPQLCTKSSSTNALHLVKTKNCKTQSVSGFEATKITKVL